MRAKKGRVRLSPNEEAQLIKEETEKRRKLRLQQVREQCKENATKVRTAVKREKHKQLMKLANELKGQLENEKEERVRHLERQYENSLRSIGVGHKQASLQPDWSEERELLLKAENLRAEARGREALERLRTETALLNEQARRHIMARKAALQTEKERSAAVAAMPPPPPDPLKILDKTRKPVKLTDMNAYSTTHYHLVDEHVIDRADPVEQTDAKQAAEVEAERIRERALELKRLRQDQLERARMRHNKALEKELLKHDYDNILHDLSDLQRADRERRLKVVHNIPKQVFEPPNVRMEDREDKQKQMEQDFEDMYMAGTDNMGDISMALDPQPRPLTPTGTDSLDVTGVSDGTPMQHPTLPAVPPVLRDMTNVQKPKSPGKKPEKVLKKLMERIKSQREEWLMSHSMIEVGEGESARDPRRQLVQGQATDEGQFQVLKPDSDSPGSVEQSPPEKLPRVHSPAETPGGAVQPPSQYPMESADGVRWMQQTNVPLLPSSAPGQLPPAAPSMGSVAVPNVSQGSVGQPSQQQQLELQTILKQQELIMEQKRQLEERLQQLNTQHQELQTVNQANSLPPMSQSGGFQVPPQVPTQVPPQQFASSMSSSGMSTQPMNSIPPSATTNTVPIATVPMPQMQQTNVNIPYQIPLVPLTTQGLLPLGTDVAMAPPQIQAGPTVGMPTIPAAPPVQEVPPITSDAHNEQLRRVKEYQQYLLARHEQSKKVLDETKAEIKRRRENLLQRYPQLDLSRLETLGAKYLQNGEELSGADMQMLQGAGFAPPPGASVGAAAPQAGLPVSSLVASLAAHPYYATTLTKPLTEKVTTNKPQPPAMFTVGSAQVDAVHPAVNFDKNSRKSQFDGVRKSLPFDADESLQSPSVRVYEAYSSKQLNQTDDADLTQTGSPALGAQLPKSSGATDSEMDSSASTSFMSDKLDPTFGRKDELQRQLADIQRQKEEIIQIHQLGQQRLQMKQDLLKAKLSTISPEELQQSMRDMMREKQEIAKQYESQAESYGRQTEDSSFTDDSLTPSKADLSNRSTEEEVWTRINSRHNLAPIPEVDTPASTRPSEGSVVPGTGRLSTSSSDGSMTLPARRSARAIAEEPTFEDVETLVQRDKASSDSRQVLGVGYRNVEDILQRAKQFEKEVLEKLRRQTNSVFDSIPEMKESEGGTPEGRPTSGMSLSTGSLSDSLSTGPLDDSSVSRLRDVRSANGSFQSKKSWAAELSSYKSGPPSESSVAFSVLKPSESEVDQMSGQQSSIFSSGTNRFKVYSSIGSEMEPLQEQSGSTSNGDTTNSTLSDVIPKTNLTATDMLQHLRELQNELKSGEEARFMAERELLAKKYLEKQKAYASQRESHAETSKNQTAGDLTQYSVSESDRSRDTSIRDVDEGRAIIHRGRGLENSKEELPVRRSPIGDLLKSDTSNARRQPAQGGDESQSEYSFAITDDKQRSTSTPGEPRTMSAMENSTPKNQSDLPLSSVTINNRSELPSEITVGSRTAQDTSVRDRPSDFLESQRIEGPSSRQKLSSYSVSTFENQSEDWSRFTADQTTPIHVDQSEGGEDLTTYSLSSQDDSRQQRDPVQFHRLSPVASQRVTSRLQPAPPPPPPPPPPQAPPLPSTPPPVQRYAVSHEGDLIADGPTHHRLSPVAKRHLESKSTDLSSYSVSTQGETTHDRSDDWRVLRGDNSSGLSGGSVSNHTQSNVNRKTVPSNLDEIRNSLRGSSEIKSASSTSLTTVTSDPTLNFTGGSTLSQYTLKTNDTQLSMTQASNASSSSSNDSNNAVNMVQERFASLDQLINESKSIIARHKVIIGKNKQLEEGTNRVEGETTETDVPPPLPAKGPPPPVKPKTWLSSPKSSLNETDYRADFSRLSSLDSSHSTSFMSAGYQASRSGNNRTADQSGSTDVNSLEYLVEHSSGITEEPLPDLSTLGSELSMVSLSRGDISDSEDSLRSFEKHELTETESLSNSQTFDDSLFNKSSELGRTAETREADQKAIQEAFALKRQKFLTQPDHRLTSMKEHVQNSHGKKDEIHPVFRAVPVAVVAEPTLSMSVKASSSKVQRGRSPTPMDIKSTQSVKDAKKSFEDKEKEIKASMGSPAPLNRALQPRGLSKVRHNEPNTQPTPPKDSGTHPRESSIPVPISPSGSKSPGFSALAGEIRTFGGSAGLAAKQPPLKTDNKRKNPPPALKPKPQRSEAKASQSGASRPGSGLTKTLSSWKKSRSLNKPSINISLSTTHESDESETKPKNSIKVLPQEAPEPLTEEERLKKIEREVYERNMRNYNPRLFRLAHKLDNDDGEERDTSEESTPSASEKSKEGRKKPKARKKKKGKK